MIPEGIGRYQPLARRMFQPLVRRLWDFEIDGLHHVPEVGPAVLCPNHAAFIDSLFLPAVLTRTLTFVGKAEYLNDWKTRHLLPALGMIPIDRGGGDKVRASLDTARDVLEAGGLFGIYPEGTRSRSGKLHKGHTGAARLAVETGAPLIPVGLVGTAAIQSPGRFTPRFGKTVGVRFGHPIRVDRYRDRVGDRNMYRELIDEVMFEIQALTDLEYVHEYAGPSERPSAVTVPAESGDPEAPGATDAPESSVEKPLGAPGLTGNGLTQRPLRPLEEVLAGS